MYCIMALQTCLLLLTLPRSFHSLNDEIFSSKIDVKARVVIFGMLVDNDVLFRGIANQPSHAYSSLYLSTFLSFFFSKNENFRQRFM